MIRNVKACLKPPAVISDLHQCKQGQRQGLSRSCRHGSSVCLVLFSVLFPTEIKDKPCTTLPEILLAARDFPGLKAEAEQVSSHVELQLIQELAAPSLEPCELALCLSFPLVLPYLLPCLQDAPWLLP